MAWTMTRGGIEVHHLEDLEIEGVALRAEATLLERQLVEARRRIADLEAENTALRKALGLQGTAKRPLRQRGEAGLTGRDHDPDRRGAG